ncbi:MAG: LysE family translocator [Pseudomonadota bacterium]
MTIELWLAFTAASIILLMIPGPTILLVLSYALAHGKKVAVATASGVALGDLIAMTASLAGLGALMVSSAAAFTIVKWLGALYLIWLGVSMIRKSGTAQAVLPQNTPEAAPATMFRHAALVTALNPKSIAFFVAFVPQFLNPQAALGPQAAILIATFVGLAALNALAYALLAARLRAQITRPSVLRWLARAGGGTLIAMGLATAATRRAAI